MILPTTGRFTPLLGGAPLRVVATAGALNFLFKSSLRLLNPDLIFWNSAMCLFFVRTPLDMPIEGLTTLAYAWWCHDNDDNNDVDDDDDDDGDNNNGVVIMTTMIMKLW